MLTLILTSVICVEVDIDRTKSYTLQRTVFNNRGFRRDIIAPAKFVAGCKIIFQITVALT